MLPGFVRGRLLRLESPTKVPEVGRLLGYLTAKDKHFNCVRVGHFSRYSQVLLLPLGVPPMPARACSTERVLNGRGGAGGLCGNGKKCGKKRGNTWGKYTKMWGECGNVQSTRPNTRRPPLKGRRRPSAHGRPRTDWGGRVFNFGGGRGSIQPSGYTLPPPHKRLN